MRTPPVGHPNGCRRGPDQRAGRAAKLAFLGLALLWLAIIPAWAQPAQTPRRTQAAPAAPKEPEPVTVTILPVGNNTFRATVVFPQAVERTQATAALDTLAQRSGWQVGNVEWQETPASGIFPAQTSVMFAVNTLFPNGEFPVEAFAVAFRAWRAILVVFQHGGTFQYRGQPLYEDPNARVEVTADPTYLTLEYAIYNPNLERLNVAPPMAPGAQPAASGSRRGMPRVGWALIAILGAALAWVLAYALMGGFSGKSRISRRIRAERR